MGRVKDQVIVDKDEVFNYLTQNKGISENHALGIIANINAESGFDAAAIGDNGSSAGLFQHHAERKDDLMKHLKGNLGDWRSQIDFALNEAPTKKYLNQDFATPQQASYHWTVNWERPSDAKNKALQRQRFLDQYSPSVASYQPEAPQDVTTIDYSLLQPKNDNFVTKDQLDKEIEKIQEKEKTPQISEETRKLEEARLLRNNIAENITSTADYYVEPEANTLQQQMIQQDIQPVEFAPIQEGLPQYAEGGIHNIVRGDTLWDLSRKYGTTVKALADLNNIKNPDLIYAGDTLKLPSNPNIPPKPTQIRSVPKTASLNIEQKKDFSEEIGKDSSVLAPVVKNVIKVKPKNAQKPTPKTDYFTSLDEIRDIVKNAPVKKPQKPLPKSPIPEEDSTYDMESLRNVLKSTPDNVLKKAIGSDYKEAMGKLFKNPTEQKMVRKKLPGEETIENTDVLRQRVMRGLEKFGIIDTKDNTIKYKKPLPKTASKEQGKVDEFYQELGAVADSYHPADSLLSYRHQFDNKKGFDYIPSPVLKDRRSTDVYNNVEGVGHFLLDASVVKGKEYSHPFNKDYINQAIKYNHYVPLITNKEDKVNVRYVRAQDLPSWYKPQVPLRQHSLADIDFNKTKKAPKGFQSSVNEVLTKGNTSTYLLFKDRNGYSRFSGGSVVFLFKDKHGNEIVRNFAGSLNGIQQEAENIKKEFKIDAKNITLGYHDVGSFSAKPKAKNGMLAVRQWEGYNTGGHSGGALLIPKQK